MEFGNTEIKPLFRKVALFRNYDNGHEDSQAIIRYIKTDIRRRISLDHFRLHRPGNLHFVILPTLLFMFFSSLVDFIVNVC